MASVCPGTINSPIYGGIFEYDDCRRGLFSRLSRIVTVHGVETLKNFQALARYVFTGCRRCKAPGMQAYYYSYFKCPGTKQMRCPVNAYPGSASNRPLRVQFGRRTRKRFSVFREAERFLDGLRWEVDQGTYDPRDYRISNPLGFETLVRKWLAVKSKEVKPRSYMNLRNYMEKAIATWGQMNVKAIAYGEIEDFLHSQNVSDKTKSNIKSGLHSFFAWIKKREKIPMPDFPEISFELGWRRIIDKETQESIIDEIHRISYNINPKIWLGIKWLATYISIRPGELLNLKEEDIDTRLGYFIIPHPKEKET